MFKIRYNGIDEKPETEESNMLSTNYTRELLDLQDVIIDKIDKTDDTIYIHIHLPVKPHKCPVCSKSIKLLLLS